MRGRGVRHVLVGDPELLDRLLLRHFDLLPAQGARKPTADEQAGDYGDDREPGE